MLIVLILFLSFWELCNECVNWIGWLIPIAADDGDYLINIFGSLCSAYSYNAAPGEWL